MLTDAACRQAACPEDRPRIRLPDGGGLYLEIGPNGSKRWFAKYRFAGKERRLAIGVYPDVGLKDARKARDDARKTRESGSDPVHARQVAKATASASKATSFEAVARELHQNRASGWSTAYAGKWLRCLERDVFPWIGALPLVEISAPVLLSALRRIEARGAVDTCHAVRQFSGQVFQYGVATGRCDRNPAADLTGALKPLQVTHMAAITDPLKVGALLRDIDAYAGQPVTRAALVLSAWLFQRPGTIRWMEWVEIDTDAALWTIPAA